MYQENHSTGMATFSDRGPLTVIAVINGDIYGTLLAFNVCRQWFTSFGPHILTLELL